MDLLVWAARANVCYLGEVVLHSQAGRHAWALPLRQRCNCTALVPGGLGAPFDPDGLHYLDKPVFTDDQEEIAIHLRCSGEGDAASANKLQP